ncbi:microtubule-associated protein 10 [Dipodomys spectabilis]|uniref:microtubule-associated protein 10 n=1 Tax=Dipodomys spectabilis TaxID=105255 RepID=UPI001C538728|nr:microtubule-associated protein 10 [Dipodomys spectabilis]
MAAAERLFSLELLVDWVCLEAAPPPRAPGPTLAFRLLDFPPLLVRPPPAAARPPPRPGAIGFGRGKACVFRLRPAALRRSRLRAALLLPPADPAPRLLGACDIPLAASAPQGRRGTFALRSADGRRVGDLALFYRLRDLGAEPPKPASDPEIPKPLMDPGLPPELPDLHLDPGTPPEPPKPALDPGHPPEPPKPAPPAQPVSAPGGPRKAGPERPLLPAASSPSPQGVELEFAANTFCPPPLYYTRQTRGRAPPAQAEITMEPRGGAALPEGALPEARPADPPWPPRPQGHVSPEGPQGPPLPAPPTGVRDHGDRPPSEHAALDTLRQLPLLNALLIELSVLYNRPVASPTQVHPHLAWLYRMDEKAPHPKPSQPEPDQKEASSMGRQEKTTSPQCPKSLGEGLKKGRELEKSSGGLPRRGTGGRLLYGLTNTLRLRLRQTNPGMLMVHEKREQYRKRHAQTWGTQVRIPSGQVKSLSLAEPSQRMMHTVPKERHLPPGSSSVESSDASRSVGRVPGEPSTAQREQRGAADNATIDSGDHRRGSAPLGLVDSGDHSRGSVLLGPVESGDHKRGSAPLGPVHSGDHRKGSVPLGLVDSGDYRRGNAPWGTTVSPVDSITSERPRHTSTWGGKLDTEGQSPCVFPQDAVGQIVGREINHGQVRTTDTKTLSAGLTDNTRSKNNCCENILEPESSDDFTSPCYSEDFCTPEDTSRSWQAHDHSSAGAASQKHSACPSKSSEARLSLRKSSSEKSSLLSPPFSAGSPVPSHSRSHVKTSDKSVEDVSSISSNDLSSSSWIKKNRHHIDQTGLCNSKSVKTGLDITIRHIAGAGCQSVDRSQSPRTSQVSSYLPSNLSELQLKNLESSSSDHFEDDDVCSLNTSKQYRDICELVINKLPGYTV